MQTAAALLPQLLCRDGGAGLTSPDLWSMQHPGNSDCVVGDWQVDMEREVDPCSGMVHSVRRTVQLTNHRGLKQRPYSGCSSEMQK